MDNPAGPALLAHADSAYHRLELDEALAAYRDAGELDPRSYEACLGIARTLSRMRAHDEALAATERCIALDPTRAEAYATQGVLFFLRDDLPAAEAACRAALERAPGDPEPRLTLAQIHCDRRDFRAADEAIAAARTAIGHLPDGVEKDELLAMAWHAETYRHLLANDTRAAQHAAEQVIAMEDASPYAAALAYSNLGIMETRSRRYATAIEHLERARAINPHLYRAAGALGHILIVRREYARAAEVLAEVVDRDPGETGDARYAYGLALARTHRRPEARTQMKQALAQGLKGLPRVLAWLQLLWLNDVARYAIVGGAALLFLAWVLFGGASQQAITLVVLIVVLGLLQGLMSRRRTP